MHLKLNDMLFSFALLSIKKIPVFGFILLLVITASILNSAPQQEDNYGIIEAQVIDAQTGEPVQEIFYMDVLRSDTTGYYSFYFNVKGNSNGFITTKIEPGEYRIGFFPYEFMSDYSDYLPPDMDENASTLIMVNKGQKVRVIHKVMPGGKLKIMLLDSKGNKFIPEDVLGQEYTYDISINLIYKDFPNLNVKQKKNLNDNLNDGEMILLGLIPGVYEMNVEPDFMGYGPIKINDIVIERGKVTTSNVVIDLLDTTGIDGYVTGLNGQPMVGAKIEIELDYVDKYYSASAKTNSKGYFRIVGIKEGTYVLLALYQPSEYRYISKYVYDIWVKKGTIVPQKVVIDY